MSTVVVFVLPDGLGHAFPHLADGESQRAFCGAASEFVREIMDEDKVCDVCAVEMQVHLGIPREEAVLVLSEGES